MIKNFNKKQVTLKLALSVIDFFFIRKAFYQVIKVTEIFCELDFTNFVANKNDDFFFK